MIVCTEFNYYYSGGRVYDNKEADRLLARFATSCRRVLASLVNNERTWWRVCAHATKERQIEIFCGFLRFLLFHSPISVFVF